METLDGSTDKKEETKDELGLHFINKIIYLIYTLYFTIKLENYSTLYLVDTFAIYGLITYMYIVYSINCHAKKKI